MSRAKNNDWGNLTVRREHRDMAREQADARGMKMYRYIGALIEADVKSAKSRVTRKQEASR